MKESDAIKQAIINAPETQHLIDNAALFRGIPRPLLDTLLTQADLIRIKPGEKLLSPGIINEKVYILLSGRLSVQTTPSLLSEPITMLAPGECVGEMSVLVDGMVSAYVIGITDCQLFAINYSSFWGFLDSSNEAARNMLNILVQRIRLGNEFMADSLLNHNPIADHDIIDVLTGLYNNHGMNSKFDRILKRCVMDKQSLCLILIKVEIQDLSNEQDGKLRLEQTMRYIGHTILSHLRPDDHAARLAGEKFSVLLKTASKADTMDTAERLKDAIKNTSILMPDGSTLPQATIKTGVSQALENDTWNTLIARSDIALDQSTSH